MCFSKLKKNSSAFPPNPFPNSLSIGLQVNEEDEVRTEASVWKTKVCPMGHGKLSARGPGSLVCKGSLSAFVVFLMLPKFTHSHTCPLTRTLIHTFAHIPTCSLTLTHSLVHLLAHSYTCLLTHSFTCSFTHLLTHTHSFIHSLIH